MRFFGLAAGASVLLGRALAVAAPQVPSESDCPDGVEVVTVQPAVILTHQPIRISSFIPSNTVLTFGSVTISVTDAPTTLVTDITLTGTSTSLSTG